MRFEESYERWNAERLTQVEVARLLGIRAVILACGLPCSFYDDRGSHYWTTPEAEGRLTRRTLPNLVAPCGNWLSK